MKTLECLYNEKIRKFSRLKLSTLLEKANEKAGKLIFIIDTGTNHIHKKFHDSYIFFADGDFLNKEKFIEEYIL